MNQEVLMAILTGIISILGVLITKVLIPYIKQKLTAEQLVTMQTLLEIAIYAAEQLYQDKSQGKTKKQYVYEYMKQRFPKLTYRDFEILLEGTGKALNIFN